MSINFLREAQAFGQELIEIRKTFHRIPEIGNHEFKTAELIEHYLDDMGITHKRILDTAITARIDGELPGLHCALRTDIDALPIEEATGCDYASQNPGMMHACGHDVHMSSVLGAAMLLKRHEKELCGSVTLLFQPDEEGDGGARRMIDAGCLEGVDAVFGAHVDPALKAGDIGIRYGNFYAASATFKIAIIGKSAHGAQRDKGIDAIEIAACLVPELLKIPGGVVTVGMLHAGTAENIIAGRAELTGIMRTFGVDERARMCRELESITQETSAKFGGSCEVRLNISCPGIINNNDKITSLVEITARETLGSEHVHRIEKPLYISEDFGYYIMAKTGCFYHVGAGCEYPLHSDKFLPDSQAIITASALHAAVASKYNTGLI